MTKERYLWIITTITGVFILVAAIVCLSRPSWSYSNSPAIVYLPGVWVGSQSANSLIWMDYTMGASLFGFFGAMIFIDRTERWALKLFFLALGLAIGVVSWFAGVLAVMVFLESALLVGYVLPRFFRIKPHQLVFESYKAGFWGAHFAVGMKFGLMSAGLWLLICLVGIFWAIVLLCEFGRWSFRRYQQKRQLDPAPA